MKILRVVLAGLLVAAGLSFAGCAGVPQNHPIAANTAEFPGHRPAVNYPYSWGHRPLVDSADPYDYNGDYFTPAGR